MKKSRCPVRFVELFVVDFEALFVVCSRRANAGVAVGR